MSLNVSWFNSNTTNYPLNQAAPTCGDCNCYFFSGSCCCTSCAASCCGPASCYVNNCCDHKYLQINDLLVFISKCQTNCQNCSSATNCSSCSAGYLLNYADNQCYSSCPQATYKNDTMYQLGGYTPTGGSYVKQNQTFCVACNATCL